MKTLKVYVKDGRLRLDEPSKFPEGTEFDLTIADFGDELDEQKRAALHAALKDAWASARGGDVQPAGALLKYLQDPE
jgi:hypothetical protein